MGIFNSIVRKSFTFITKQIALFMDMTPSHLASTVLKHISLKFYLDDSAHLLQPLNQGVIQTFKACYRRRLLQTTLARASNTDDSLLALQGISELDAIFWIQVKWHFIVFYCSSMDRNKLLIVTWFAFFSKQVPFIMFLFSITIINCFFIIIVLITWQMYTCCDNEHDFAFACVCEKYKRFLFLKTKSC